MSAHSRKHTNTCIYIKIVSGKTKRIVLRINLSNIADSHKLWPDQAHAFHERLARMGVLAIHANETSRSHMN